MTPARRLVLIGLDGLEPSLVFDRLGDALRNLTALTRRGLWGPLESCDPPITIPAWSCMLSGRDPGELGCYGFRRRVPGSYHEHVLASSADIQAPRLWDLAGAAGLRSLVLSVPQTYPAPAVDGLLVAGFPLPGDDEHAYSSAVARSRVTQLLAACLPSGQGPAEGRATTSHPEPTRSPQTADQERSRVAEDRSAPLRPPAAESQADSAAHDRPGYLHDFAEHRQLSLDGLLARQLATTRQRFALARALIQAEPWDLLILVDMAADRIHHACLSDALAGHQPQASALHAVYQALDAEVGALVAMLRDDDLIAVVSDHGGQPMHGGFGLNQWLLERGFLKLLPVPGAQREDAQDQDPRSHAPGHLDRPGDQPSGSQASHPAAGARRDLPRRSPTLRPFDPDRVDWASTLAWAEGGYCGRIHLNLRGREPHGRVEPDQRLPLLRRLAEELAAERDLDGLPAGHVVVAPRQCYRDLRGQPPDLLVYPSGLTRRALASLGALWTPHDDRGPDQANHSPAGVAILVDGRSRGRRADLSLYDVLPTLLERLGLPAPAGLRGKVWPRGPGVGPGK